MPRTLTIKDDDGVVLGKLKIPDGASVEQITAAGLAARERLLAKRNTPAVKPASAAPTPAPTKPRQVKCQHCGDIFVVELFPAHVREYEKTIAREQVRELNNR